ncbi:MAG: magnesium-translocating P-type ATPase [bacterium]
MMLGSQTFWSLDSAALLNALETSPQGLPREAAEERRLQYGPNLLKPAKRSDTLSLLLAQFKSPIILLLLFAAGLSFFLHDRGDALIISGIVLASALLGFWQEKGAARAVGGLLATVQTKSVVLRDGAEQEIPLEEVVPGDIVVLSAGAVAPGDGRLLEARDLFVNEASLTGETFPVEKAVAVLAPDTPLVHRTNCLFMGTHVVSGSGKAVVVQTGRRTEFGQVAGRLELRPPETEFEHGIRAFGNFLLEVTLVLVILIFGMNVYFHRSVLDSFLFALALAVGLTPQLLPAIIGINLAHGAARMAGQKVIVKRLASIENFGSMNVLCSDKTGTLTEGQVVLQGAVDLEGRPSEKVLLYGYLNAIFETGFVNPLDEAMRGAEPVELGKVRKLDEVPYDFVRKRLSILVEKDGRALMITKGAVQSVLAVSDFAAGEAGHVVALEKVRGRLQNLYERVSREGRRTLGIACRELEGATRITREQEAGMTFLGLLVFSDRPKAGVEDTLRRLRDLGISLKIITGDNRLVAEGVSREVGILNPGILTGPELRRMSDEALILAAGSVDVFAEVEPNQKERIILALKKAGNVVGFMGDGINDASALHAADVGISVQGAVDVAKEAADVVLLEKGLDVLDLGVREGRKTFANTLKYVFMATSANFGNMFSMAGASLFLPFLPLLPKQILLTNLLTDFPEMTIAGDSVDPAMVERPRRWKIEHIRRFMLFFGTLSSVFDYLTFGILLLVLKATPGQFRTGWFLESVVSACLVVLVIRTRQPIVKCRPSVLLLLTTCMTLAVATLLPYSRFAALFDFEPLEPRYLVLLGGVVVIYILCAELLKKIFYRRAGD